jgi:hypothetical protein
MSDQVADVLDDAADRLEREGWAPGVGGGGHCALGALYSVAGMTALRQRASRVLADSLGLPYRYRIADWNDAPGRTKQEVLDAFRLAAKAERMRPETPAPPGTPDPCGVGTGLAGDAPMSG